MRVEVLRHAPRERVSWNIFSKAFSFLLPSHAPRERVSWNLENGRWKDVQTVTLHVSVWVEISADNSVIAFRTSHAPRERVSWNKTTLSSCMTKQVTLHVSVWVEIHRRGQFWGSWKASRSTWACELKLLYLYYSTFVNGHAPRERVSWNCIFFLPLGGMEVTLHVSVWVEMKSHTPRGFSMPSRSTWACELK